MVYTYDFCLARAHQLSPDYHWKHHNGALKWFRHVDEAPVLRGEPAQPWRTCDPRGEQVGECHHEAKGTEFWFDHERVDWCWLDMVSQLELADMRWLCDGYVENVGIVKCIFASRNYSCDLQRHATAPGGDEKLRSWDFIVVRADDTAVRLHPEWKNRQIAVLKLEPHDAEVMPPPQGKGKKGKPGTYKSYKVKDVDFYMHFRRMHDRLND